MTRHIRSHGDDLRGASRLALDATKGVMRLVETMHRTIASGPALLGSPLERPARVITGIVYDHIVGVTELVGVGIERALTELTPFLGEGAPGPEREAVHAALLGVLGDHIAETGNPLAVEMCFRRDGVALDLDAASLRARIPDATSKLCVMVHGSSMNDLQWTRRGHDHGAALARDLGVTTVYLRYNSGLHVSTNGRAFAALLEALTAAWPVPLDEIILVGHSMGGLVARSAVHAAEAEGYAFRAKLRAMVFLGTPHHGAPLERGGAWLGVLLGVSRYSAPFIRLGEIRSAGVTDLRHGAVLDAHWEGRDRFELAADPRASLALPDGVACYAIAASLARAPGEGSSAAGRFLDERLVGDGLVPVDSALGRHRDARLALALPDDRQWIAYETGHLDLLDRADVYETMRAWLAAATGARPPAA